jgi:heme A synthase
MVALGVYLVSVALLPDTRFSHLLLAVTAAVLVVAFRALVRSQLELRWSGQTPPTPSP